MGKFIKGLARFLRYFVRPIFPVKIYGPRKYEIKKTLFVGNHVSGWDPVLFYAWTQTHVSFMYKAEFRKSAFLRKALDDLECVPVNRGEVDLNATHLSLRLLKSNKPLAVFPEGKRNPDVEHLLPLKTGAALFAIKTKAPLRAFYVWDRARAFRKNYYMVGEEFDLSQFYDQPVTKEVLNEATGIIRAEMEKLRVQLDGILAAKGKKRRKRTRKELKKIKAFRESQRESEESTPDEQAVTAAAASADEGLMQ